LEDDDVLECLDRKTRTPTQKKIRPGKDRNENPEQQREYREDKNNALIIVA
jgi:hypothetical protein